MPNLIDRARHRLARWIGTPSGAQVRRFQAARIDRLSADWLASEASLNHELRTDLNRLRARGRELLQNNDYAVKFAGMCKANIIGPGGIRLQVRVEDAPGRPDRLANDAIEAAWRTWSQACDLTGRQSLRDLCETLVGSLPSDGEFLVRLVRGAESGNAFGLALQLIDVDRIDTSYNVGATASSNAVIMGVEVDAYRRPLALHLFAAHPNDGLTSSRQRLRLDAAELLHCFKTERAEQVRGIPWMAPGMLSLHHLGNFKLSALLAAEHGANHYGFFSSPDGQAPIGAPDANGEQVAVSQPGTYDTLPAGVTFQAHESKYPNEVFGPFVKTTLQRIASGWRVAYHSLANDLEGVSYSSIRSGALEERDRWAADQEWFIAAFLEPVYRAWLQTALLSGAITMQNGSALPAAKAAKFGKHDWQPRRWEWVDPKGDMEAKILAVKAGLMAPQDLAAAMGYDFDDTLSAIAAAQALAAQLGVQLPAYDGNPGATTAAIAAANTASADTPATPSRELIALQEQVRELQQLRQAALAAPLPPAAPPVVNIAMDINASSIERAITQASAPYFEQFEATARSVLERDMPIVINVPEAPAPQITVNVEAPQVTLEATVPQPSVIVNNTHPSRAVQVVERDANDEITRTITTYLE